MLVSVLLLAPLVGAAVLGSGDAKCPGYKASNVKETGHSLTADLVLAGKPCNTFGTDLKELRLLVEYQSNERLHVMIHDKDEKVYQVPESVFPRPKHEKAAKKKSALKFEYKKDPFSFKVLRGKEVLFDTSASNLIFQSQYLNLRTWLPKDPNLYGLGEHSDPLRLKTEKYTRTMWNRDSYGIPANSNLYGTHPVYYDHRGTDGTHAVFLLNSNGMDVKIDRTKEGKQFLEYNTQGGVFDFYFLAGPTPRKASAQYAEVVGRPAMQSYWTFGFHQCRYGYRDAFEVAEVVANYSNANIPLETMWTDIDYMDKRRIFTLDPERFPLKKMRELVSYLHDHNQQYIVMVDPAVGVSDNGAYNRGKKEGTLMKRPNGDIYEGVVWPGVAAFPDWFNPKTQEYWNNEFSTFFSAKDGVDIDGLWIDMNEASNFCPFPCKDPAKFAKENDNPPTPPPVRPNPRPLPGFPDDFQPGSKEKRANDAKAKKIGLPDRDLLNPKYKIANSFGSISNKTINTDLIHAGTPYAEYDTHNLYGSMMSVASRRAMEERRPKKRPFVITRSTFAGAGRDVGKWLGDNLSQWDHYRVSIAQMLAFASMFQIPMVGSDVCGFGGNTTEELCARWVSLGAFYPFFRNHNELGSISQEFYRWPVVAESARKAIDLRYRLLDYTYSLFHRQSETGEPFLNPMFYLYPGDKNTYGIDHQFFYGDILVSPVIEKGKTEVTAYFPKDLFYDYYTGKKFQGEGKAVTLKDIKMTDIPLHVRSGSIIARRMNSANTTTELRKQPMELIIAPDRDNNAEGFIYADDGESIEQPKTMRLSLKWKDGTLHAPGDRSFKTPPVKQLFIYGQDGGKGKKEMAQRGLDRREDGHYDSESGVLIKEVDIDLSEPFSIDI